MSSETFSTFTPSLHLQISTKYMKAQFRSKQIYSSVISRVCEIPKPKLFLLLLYPKCLRFESSLRLSHAIIQQQSNIKKCMVVLGFIDFSTFQMKDNVYIYTAYWYPTSRPTMIKMIFRLKVVR